MRLDRFICKSTNYTRVEAKELIDSGRVTVNHVTDIHEAYQVHENNEITLDGMSLSLRPSRYIMLHKPAGFLSSNADGRYPSLFNLLDIADVDNLHLAGRLDRDTTGLVLITDDGRWTFNLISPDKNCEKRYRVGLRNDITSEAITALESGLKINGFTHMTKPAKVEVVHSKEVLLTITEGKYHQVKRMFQALNNKVVKLHRESIGKIELNIPEGEWRYLAESEVAL